MFLLSWDWCPGTELLYLMVVLFFDSLRRVYYSSKTLNQTAFSLAVDEGSYSLKSLLAFFFWFCLGAIPDGTQSFLLTINSGIMANFGDLLDDIDWTQVGYMQGKSLPTIQSFQLLALFFSNLFWICTNHSHVVRSYLIIVLICIFLIISIYLLSPFCNGVTGLFVFVLVVSLLIVVSAIYIRY